MCKIKWYLHQLIPRIYDCPTVILIIWLNHEFYIRKELK